MGYLILAGVGVSIVTSALRYLSTRFGKEASRNIVLIGVLVLSIAAATVWHFTPDPLWQEALLVLGVAVGFYETVVKTVVMPALEKRIK